MRTVCFRKQACLKSAGLLAPSIAPVPFTVIARRRRHAGIIFPRRTNPPITHYPIFANTAAESTPQAITQTVAQYNHNGRPVRSCELPVNTAASLRRSMNLEVRGCPPPTHSGV
jgi:hypothetical protein